MIRAFLAISLIGATTLLSGCDIPAGAEEADLDVADEGMARADGFDDIDAADEPRLRR
jgi:hypothetical protein